MTENIEEQSQYTNKNFGSNQLRSNQIRNKKASVPQDREQLYAENFELKTKVKQLLELNIKLKTQLSINQKQKVNICNIAEEELFHPKYGNRSQTGHKKSVTNIINQQQNGQSLFNNPLQKQKQSIAFKKIVRDQNIELQKLNNEILRLKKTMKYTRMNEILAENSQLLNQTLRLKDIISQQRDNQNRVYNDFANQVDQLRKKLTQEKDSQKRNGFQLKKQLQTNQELKEKLNEMESKKIDMEKRLNKQLKQYRNQVAELRSKLFEQANKANKQCQKDECLKNKKEKSQLKKKIQNYEKDLRRLKGQVQEKNKLINQTQSQLKKTKELSVISKSPEKKDTSNYVNKKEENRPNQLESKLTEKKDVKDNVFLGQQSKSKSQTQSLLTNKTNKVQQQNAKKMEKQAKKESQTVKESENRKRVPSKLQQRENQSFDTQKLLESFQEEKNNLKIQPSSVINKQQLKKVKASEVVEKHSKLDQQTKKKLVQSDGQYENLDYDQEFQDQATKDKKSEKIEKEQKKKKTHKQAGKEAKQQKQKEKPSNQEKIKKQPKKGKSKSNKKLQPTKNHEQDEQMLYSADKEREGKQAEGDKEQLKLIRDTLIYKFMAQNYSFENFCTDINGSDMKEFSITDIMNLLSGEPFLLHQEHIETVVIYLFDTVQPTGQESLSAKEFIKKMKKFIGKAKPINQEEESNNIQHLSQIIVRDEQGQQKIRAKLTDLDSGDGSISVEQFKKIMTAFKIKDSLLQTAVSQITYVSQDLNHLNYDLFLRRFIEGEN